MAAQHRNSRESPSKTPWEKFTKKDSKFRGIWLVLFLFSFVGLTCVLVSLSIQFYEEPTASLMRVEPPKEFPNVVYCPKLWADPAKLRLFEISAHLYAYIDSLFFQNQFSFVFDQTEIDVSQRREDLVRKTKDKLSTFNNLLSLIRYKPNDLVRSAEKKQIDFVRTDVRPIDNLAGGCIALTPNGTGVEPRPGYLRMIVRFEEMRETFDLDDRVAKRSPGRGSLYVGSRALAPFPEGGFPVDDRRDYNVQLEAKFIERISTRSFQCRKYTTADRSQCIIDCYNRLLIDSGLNCSFYNPRGKVKPNSPGSLCSRLDSYFYNYWYYLDLSQCDGKCQKPCRQSTYTLTAYVQQSSSNHSYISMYFADAQNALFVSEARIYTLDKFLSNLGGLVSLFLGASILSIGQLLWACCVDPALKAGRRKTKKFRQWRRSDISVRSGSVTNV